MSAGDLHDVTLKQQMITAFTGVCDSRKTLKSVTASNIADTLQMSFENAALKRSQLMPYKRSASALKTGFWGNSIEVLYESALNSRTAKHSSLVVIVILCLRQSAFHNLLYRDICPDVSFEYIDIWYWKSVLLNALLSEPNQETIRD